MFNNWQPKLHNVLVQ